MNALITDFFAFTVSRGKVQLTWTLNSPDWHTLKIERVVDGGAPELLEKVIRGEQYLDATAPTGSLNRNIEYRLSVEGLDLPPFVVLAGATKRDPEAAEIATGQRILLRKYGLPVALFSIKSTGSRCACYNIVRGQSDSDDCPKCKGTGITDGYAAPRIVYMLGESRDKKNVSVIEAGEIEQSDRILWTNADVRVRSRDVLVTAGSNRYRVEGVEQGSIRESPTRQVIRCLELNPSSVEFDFEIPPEMIQILQRQPGRSLAL